MHLHFTSYIITILVLVSVVIVLNKRIFHISLLTNYIDTIAVVRLLRQFLSYSVKNENVLISTHYLISSMKYVTLMGV